MWKKIVQLVHGKDCELRESMFRTIILVGGLATVVGIGEILIVMDVTTVLVPFLIALLGIMAISFVATFKYSRYDFASTLIGLLIIVMIFPVMFMLSGGIDSGAAIWFTLGILYIFIMFSGAKLVAFLILSAISYGVTYWMAYTQPELIVPMPSTQLVYIDSYFSILAIGMVSGMILKVHMRLFEAEHELNIRQKEELERNSSTKNTLFANMSHEIRTPINAIIGLNEMILRANPTGETRVYAQDIQVASKMLLNQVNDILDLSQVEMNKMKIIPVQYKTENLISDLVEMVRVQLDKKKLEFYLDVDKNLPTVLLGDEKRLKQVLLNILDNAVKYTEAGSVTMAVQGEKTGNGEILLKVKIADTGIGIRSEDIEHIYDSFNRVDEKKNSGIMGSGLGLAITKQLVDLMDGEINIDSIYTKGTIFTVAIKQTIVDEQAIGTVNFMKRKSKGDVYKPGFEAPEARVLVVDDNPMNSMVAKSLLSATKVQVDVVASGSECLEMTKTKYYHVILLDYMMPGMNGSDTRKAIKTQENGLCRDSAIIVLTGNALSGARQHYLDEGFDGYVEKPIEGRLLELEILKFLPPDIIEYLEPSTIDPEEYNQMRRITMQKRKKVYITTDCVCDIPKNLCEKYDIKLMYLYIRTPNGRFADTIEIDSDSLTQYISSENSTAYADSVTVEEYEEFFANVLTQAECVIHISLAKHAGKSYDVAVQAARGFDHVRVIDSGQISGGQALITLCAAKWAMEGMSADDICEQLEHMKSNVKSRFIMPNVKIFQQNGHTNEWAVKACKMFQLHPYVALKQSKPVLVSLLSGDMPTVWKRGIRLILRNKRHICRDIIIVTHVGCTVKQQEMIQQEILKCIPFERVIIQKASFSNACNSGIETIGLAFYTN